MGGVGEVTGVGGRCLEMAGGGWSGGWRWLEVGGVAGVAGVVAGMRGAAGAPGRFLQPLHCTDGLSCHRGLSCHTGQPLPKGRGTHVFKQKVVQSFYNLF